MCVSEFRWPTSRRFSGTKQNTTKVLSDPDTRWQLPVDVTSSRRVQMGLDINSSPREKCEGQSLGARGECLFQRETMWGLVLLCLFLQSVALGRGYDREVKEEEEDRSKGLNEMKMQEFESFLDDMKDWSAAAAEYVQVKSGGELETPLDEEGRKLKYKRAEMKFMMKTLLIFKLILGLFLPVGVVAAKIISWKSVTLSLMAFMLAKILFVKNLLTGKNAFAVTPTNYAPPLYVHGGVHDVLWKRQGETQVTYPWTST